jgi:hypothetical protein
MFIVSDEQENPERYRQTNVAEIEEIKNVILRKP